MTSKNMLLLEWGAQGQFVVKDTLVLNASGLESNCEKGPEMFGSICNSQYTVPFIAISQSQHLGII